MMTDRLAALLTLLESQPEDAFCLYGIAMEHRKAGDLDEAIAYFDRTLAADPDHAYAAYHKARTQDEAGATDAALATIDQGLAAARRSGDSAAAGELAALRDELT